MDLNGFWEIVGASQGDTDAIVETLEGLPLPEIADFAQIHDGLEWEAYRNDLWLACVLINHGFGSDDGFLYFRDWLILQGREVYEAALSNPDSLAQWPETGLIVADDDDFADREDFLYVADTAWTNLTGKDGGLLDELIARGFTPKRDMPYDLAGEHIPFADRERVFAALPRLSALGYERAARTRGSLPGKFGLPG